LRDFLPAQIPYARILLFGYNSNVAFETSIAGVGEQAASLLNRLSLKRENIGMRPIVFIAHSLGGIIVKRALITAKLDSCYHDIYDAASGIAFFGTPHRGSAIAKFGDVAASIIRAVFHNPKNTFMDALKKDSMFSDFIIDDFRHQVERYQILSFFETEKIKNLGIVSFHPPCYLAYL